MSAVLISNEWNDDAYEGGKAAFYRGLPRSMNPYPLNSDKAKAWYQGWDDASNQKVS